MDMPRLFAAVDIGPGQAAALEQLRDETLKARWTPPDQFHLTLRFLGDVEEDTSDQLIEVLAEAKVEPFELGGDGLDVFPSRRRPRVLVARIDRHPQLMRLQQQIDRRVLGLGIPEDRRSFNPHVTLARLKGAGPQEVREFMKQHADFRLGAFRVDRFHLYRSDLGPNGAVHTVLETYRLTDPA